MIPATLSKAQVVSVDPDNLAIYVYLTQNAGEGPVSPVKVLVNGPFDGMRISQSSLPARGTLGVVAALDGDARSLVWLGSLSANLQDSISTIPGQSNIECLNHYSGFYYFLDESGNYSAEFPDGTFIQIGPTINTPNGHRVIEGNRTVISLPLSARVSNSPSPFPFSYTHPTGTEISIDSSGNVNVSGVGTVGVSGATVVNIYSPAGIGLRAPTVSVSGNLVVDGNISAFSSSGTTSFSVSGTISATEDIVASTAGNNISVTSHLHSGVQTGGSNTQAPVSNT